MNIAAILITGAGILVAVQTYAQNVGNDSFWMELSNPIAIALTIFPFIVAGVLMHFSRRADREMEEILRAHEADSEKKMSRKKGGG